MDEAAWLSCTNPTPMLQFLRRLRVSDRKVRLLACGLWRRNENLLPAPELVNDLRAVESYVDRLTRWEDLAPFRQSPLGVAAVNAWTAVTEAIWAVRLRNWRVHHRGESWDPPAWELLTEEVRQQACELLHNLFGPLPFRAIDLPPSVRSWNDATVVRLARAVYEDRTFGDLPILADALEEAGCTEVDLLGHCRGPGPHTRGCWAVDLILQKT